MRIVYHPEARRELLEAGHYYLAVGGEELHQGFEAEYHASIERILEDPLRWRIRGRAARRFNLKRFPYYIAYIVRDDTFWIVAVAYGGRKPFYWKRRAEGIE